MCHKYQVVTLLTVHMVLQSSTEARCLADQVELYYSRPTASKLALMKKFTKEPTLFSHEDLIAEMNSITLGDSAAVQK